MEVSRSEPHSPASTGADEPARRPRVAKAVGVVVTVAWFVVCLFYIQRYVGWSNLLELLPHELGAILLGAFAPIVFLWLALAFFDRDRALAQYHRAAASAASPRSDGLRDVAEALRRHTDALARNADQSQDRLRAAIREETDRLERAYRATLDARPAVSTPFAPVPPPVETVPSPTVPPPPPPPVEPVAAPAPQPAPQPASAPRAAPMPHHRDTIDIAEVFRRLWRRRATIAAAVVVIVGVAAAVLTQLTPLYRAQTLVLVESRGPRLVELDPIAPAGPLDNQSVQSEIEIIRSQNVITKVVDRIDLVRVPEFNPDLRPKGFLASLRGGADPSALPLEERRARQRAQVVDALTRRLEVGTKGQSRVIAIGFTSADPRLAYRVANAIADAYIEEQLETKFDATQKVAGFLEERIGELRERVETSERAVERFRAAAGLFEGRGGTLASQEVADINTQLVQARASRTEIESRLNQVRRQLRVPGGYQSVPEVLASPLIQRLREQEIVMERRITELAQEIGERHPRMVSARAERRDLQIQIEAEIAKIVQSLENSAAAARAREASVQASLDQTKTQIAESSKSEIELRALEREARANRALLESFLGRFKATNAQEEARFQQPDARIVSRGEVPDRPAFPQTVPILAIALIVALLIGAMIALIQEQFERGFRSAEEIERLTGIPGLGFVPWLGRRVRRGLTPDAFMVERPSSAFAESIRSAYAGIVLSRDGRVPRSILVTSAQSDEGKTAIALSLARLRAMASSRVVIVDADLRAPAVHDRIRIPRAPGLSEVLRGSVTLDDALRQDERTGAYLLPAGGPSAHPSDLLAAPAMRQLLDTLARRFDLVVIDSPPVRAAADARILSNLAEVTLFVVRWGRTRREAALQALRQIEVPGRPLRVLVSMVDVRRHARYGFGDSGYYFGRDRKYYAE